MAQQTKKRKRKVRRKVKLKKSVAIRNRKDSTAIDSTVIDTTGMRKAPTKVVLPNNTVTFKIRVKKK